MSVSCITFDITLRFKFQRYKILTWFERKPREKDYQVDLSVKLSLWFTVTIQSIIHLPLFLAASFLYTAVTRGDGTRR
jgi:lipopolysaccharide export LptBFGC system permease protein LptF